MSKLIALKIKQLKTSLRNHVPERMLRHHSLMGAIRIWLVALQKGCRPFRNIVDYGMNRPQKRCWQATESSQQDISSSANSESAAYDWLGLNRPTITNIARKGVSLLDFFRTFVTPPVEFAILIATQRHVNFTPRRIQQQKVEESRFNHYYPKEVCQSTEQ